MNKKVEQGSRTEYWHQMQQVQNLPSDPNTVLVVRYVNLVCVRNGLAKGCGEVVKRNNLVDMSC